MRVIWKVRSWEKQRDFFDRSLEVRTEELAPVDRCVLEYVVQECRESRFVMRRLRHHFREIREEDLNSHMWNAENVRPICVPDYFESADGREMTLTAIAREKFDNPNLVSIPSHFQKHDIDLMISENSPPQPDPHLKISLNQDEINALSYFVRDAKELKQSAFHIGRGPSLHSTAGQSDYSLRNFSEEQARSYITIFRRLYMDGEPGNFIRACELYCDRFLNKRITDWVGAEKKEYQSELTAPYSALFPRSPFPFSTKRLLDVFIYTRYAYQPSKDRTRQYNECLLAVGNADKLFWFFLTAVREISLYYINVLPYIENEIQWYLKATNLSPSIDCSPLSDNSVDGRRQLVDVNTYDRFQEYASRLAVALWSADQQPNDALPKYLRTATSQLKEALLTLGIRVGA